MSTPAGATTSGPNPEQDEAARKAAIKGLVDRRRQDLKASGQPIPSQAVLWQWATQRHKEITSDQPHHD